MIGYERLLVLADVSARIQTFPKAVQFLILRSTGDGWVKVKCSTKQSQSTKVSKIPGRSICWLGPFQNISSSFTQYLLLRSTSSVHLLCKEKETNLKMCILFVYRKITSQGKYKLILASNRDEFYPRPAKVAHIWQEYSTMLGGRDMEPGREGGTWLAMNKESGKIGVLLNISTPKMAKDKKGRGKIVSDYAISPISISDYCDNLNLEASAYNPFNFVAVDTLELPISSVTCYCSDESSSLKLDSDEFLGFGNSPYAKPYQKVAQGLVKFQTTVQKHNDDDSDVALSNELLQILKAETRYWPDNQLQQQTSSFSEEFQRGLSSVFVRIPQARYGTRTHTIITVDNENNCKFQEWTMKEPIPDAGNPEWVHTCFRFRIGA